MHTNTRFRKKNFAFDDQLKKSIYRLELIKPKPERFKTQQSNPTHIFRSSCFTFKAGHFCYYSLKNLDYCFLYYKIVIAYIPWLCELCRTAQSKFSRWVKLQLEYNEKIIGIVIGHMNEWVPIATIYFLSIVLFMVWANKLMSTNCLHTPNTTFIIRNIKKREHWHKFLIQKTCLQNKRCRFGQPNNITSTCNIILLGFAKTYLLTSYLTNEYIIRGLFRKTPLFCTAKWRTRYSAMESMVNHDEDSR